MQASSITSSLITLASKYPLDIFLIRLMVQTSLTEQRRGYNDLLVK